MSTGKRYKMVSTSTLTGVSSVRSGSAVSLPAAKTAIALDPPVASTSYHVVFSNTRNTENADVQLPPITDKSINDFSVTPPEAVVTDWELFLDT
jgi:hypothetical protein